MAIRARDALARITFEACSGATAVVVANEAMAPNAMAKWNAERTAGDQPPVRPVTTPLKFRQRLKVDVIPLENYEIERRFAIGLTVWGLTVWLRSGLRYAPGWSRCGAPRP
jgi:hypothetical protein